MEKEEERRRIEEALAMPLDDLEEEGEAEGGPEVNSPIPEQPETAENK